MLTAKPPSSSATVTSIGRPPDSRHRLSWESVEAYRFPTSFIHHPSSYSSSSFLDYPRINFAGNDVDYHHPSVFGSHSCIGRAIIIEREKRLNDLKRYFKDISFTQQLICCFSQHFKIGIAGSGSTKPCDFPRRTN